MKVLDRQDSREIEQEQKAYVSRVNDLNVMMVDYKKLRHAKLGAPVFNMGLKKDGKWEGGPDTRFVADLPHEVTQPFLVIQLHYILIVIVLK